MQSALAGQALQPRPFTSNIRCNNCHRLLVRSSHENSRLQQTNVPASLLLASSLIASGAPAQAADVVSQIADGSSVALPTAVAGLGAIGVLGATLIATDPSRRRAVQMEEAGGDEKAAVKQYFNTVGFDRWNRIYSESDDVNSVQLDIREGHQQTVDKALAWFAEEGGVQGTTICDAGCGTGVPHQFPSPSRAQGAAVTATDISEAMVAETKQRYDKAVQDGAAAPAVPPVFEAVDLESVKGTFHTVCCIDVLIHYPQEKVDEMLGKLSEKAQQRIILSFAPSTPYYEVLKRIGELFPKGAKATRAYLHKEADVEACLNRLGWKVVKREMTATKFYFSRMLEAVRA
eukprot:jgi/Botrbrau1/20494/Bobra.145_2s0053.1